MNNFSIHNPLDSCVDQGGHRALLHTYQTLALKPRSIHIHSSLNFRPSHSPRDSHIHLAWHSPSFCTAPPEYPTLTHRHPLAYSSTQPLSRILTCPLTYAYTISPWFSFSPSTYPATQSHTLAHSPMRTLIDPDSHPVPPPTQSLTRIHTRPLTYAYTDSPRFSFSYSTYPATNSHTHSPTHLCVHSFTQILVQSLHIPSRPLAYTLAHWPSPPDLSGNISPKHSLLAQPHSAWTLTKFTNG
jgi:hypothetical protein